MQVKNNVRHLLINKISRIVRSISNMSKLYINLKLKKKKNLQHFTEFNYI